MYLQSSSETRTAEFLLPTIWTGIWVSLTSSTRLNNRLRASDVENAVIYNDLLYRTIYGTTPRERCQGTGECIFLFPGGDGGDRVAFVHRHNLDSLGITADDA